MSNSEIDILKSINGQLSYLKWLKDKTRKNIWDGRIFQLERMKLEIEWRFKNDGIECT